MGSRAIVIVGRDDDVPRRRFGILEEGPGICYTRTGRRFFDDEAIEVVLLERVRSAAEAVGLFDSLASDWLLLDCELMPWSAKAQELLRAQYAAVGSAARVDLQATVESLQAADGRGDKDVLERFRSREADARLFVDAYRRYCWPVREVGDLKLAPFHVLASEGVVHLDKPHSWHMETAAALAAADGELLVATQHTLVDTTAPESLSAATLWWEALTAEGGEGMVVKPNEFVVRGRRGLVQPALKTRGREYLRIIYGPEYTEPENLERLRARGLGRKRSLALREFALGIEALERFVRGEPLRRVHECAFAVLALESEPVDPRL